MECRPGCGACCIAPSISSPIPAMPQGKPAGIRCHQLDDNNLCKVFDQPARPLVCRRFAADDDTCGANSEEAMEKLYELERLTR